MALAASAGVVCWRPVPLPSAQGGCRRQPGPRQVGELRWPKSAAQNPQEIVRRLTELNKEISEGRRVYNPFALSTE
jgi:hypothetical protein